VLADKGYDADRVRSHIRAQGAIPNIPNKANRKKRFRWKKSLNRERNHVERFFNKLNQFRRIATRYDKLGATFFAFVQLASVRIWLRSIESTSWYTIWRADRMSKPVRVAFLDAVHPAIRSLAAERVPASMHMSFTASKQERDRCAAAADAEVAFIIGTGIDAALLTAAPRLRFIQKLGAGTDRIDRDACRTRGVTVARLEAGNAVPVAEHTVLLMLAALRRLPVFDRRTRAGAWLKEDGRGVQPQLAGKRVGLVGFGAIGKEVAKRLRGFDVEVVYFDPMPTSAAIEQELGVARVDLDELLATADVVSLHLPLGPETRNIIDARRIGLMKRGATIVNCARGGLINEAALVDALEQGGLHAAGLDTFAQEPPAGSPLLGRDDVVVTPHLAGATYDNFALALARGIANAERFLAGLPLAPAEIVVGPPA
jgi:D-3-phosphoglycerate dehydrogenase / 2-oxoglutarate reductase